MPVDFIMNILLCIVLISMLVYLLYLRNKTTKLLKELNTQIKLAAKISKENILLQKEKTMLKEEHLKEIMAVNEVVRSQEQYVYDLEQKLKKGTKTTKTKKETTKKETTKKETTKKETTKKTKKKGENK